MIPPNNLVEPNIYKGPIELERASVGSINFYLIKAGAARCDHDIDQAPLVIRDAYKKAENSAKSHRAGIWKGKSIESD